MKKKRKTKVKRPPYYCETRQSWIIQLTQGRETLVDADDALAFANCNLRWVPRGGAHGYAGFPGGCIKLHRVIMNAPNGMVVDHINGNTLDNRKANLRVCTQRENLQNMQKHRSGKLVGGTFCKRQKKWLSNIRINGKLKYLGYYPTELEAHEAYMRALKELAGN